MTQQTIARRYAMHAPGDGGLYGIDWSFILPRGVGIQSAGLTFWTNWAEPADASADWTIDAQLGIRVRGRSVVAWILGGKAGTDYQLRWNMEDTLGNLWTRTGLLLCANAS